MYGVKKVNEYLYNHSKSWLWPFRTNHIHQITFGKSFETLVAEYKVWLLKQGEGMVLAEGDEVAQSQFPVRMNNNCDKIFFLVSDAQHAPELVRFYKHDKSVDLDRESFLSAKVLNRHDEYMTQTFSYINPTKVASGLFDDEGYIVEGTENRAIQGYLKDGIAVYFDVPSSFVHHQLYVGDTFYAQTNSSVIIDKDDNLYYFVQNSKTRTLYKNKTAIYSYEGYYGVPADVDAQGRVYFIANSKKGSTLYRVEDGVAERVLLADNIADARIINDDELLLEAVGEDRYYFVVNKISAQQQQPYNTTFSFESAPFFANKSFEALKATPEASKMQSDTTYYSPLNLKYASTSLSMGSGSNNGDTVFVYNVNIDFEDPLLTNRLGFFASQGVDRIGVVGGSYDNNRHLLEFGGSAYYVYNDGNTTTTYHNYNENNNSYGGTQYRDDNATREYGVAAYLRLPVYEHGFTSSALRLDYYQDYKANARNPLVATASLRRAEAYGVASGYEYLSALSLYGVYDRSDYSYGGTYRYQHGIFWKMFVGFGLQGVRTDYDASSSAVEDQTKGVQFSNAANSVVNDPSVIVMPNLEYTRYVKQAAVGSVHLKKQFDGRLYFFTFPISIMRESLYARYRYLDIQDFGQSNDLSSHTKYNETTIGGGLNLMLLNHIPLPVSIEYVHNDNTKERDNVRLLLGASF